MAQNNASASQFEMLLERIREKKNNEALHIMMLNVGKDDLKSDTGMELLHYAAFHGNDVITQHLINAGVDVDAFNGFKHTPLGSALVGDADEKTIKTLLHSKASLYHVVNRYSILEFVFSVEAINWTIKSWFLERLKSDCFNNIDTIAEKLLLHNVRLCHAALLKDVEVLKIMLSRGCLVSDSDTSFGRTALHVAVILKDLETIKFLLRSGADINAVNFEGLIPLALACDYDETAVEYEILNYLLDQGSSLNIQIVDIIDQKAHILHVGKRAIVRTLMLRHVVDFSTQDHSGRTSLDFIARNTALAKGSSIIEELKQCSIDINILNNSDESPLLPAAAYKNLWLVSFLLESGVNVNQRNINNVSALYLATRCSSYSTRNASEKRNICSLVELLLQYGADPQFVTGRKNRTVIDNILRQKSYDLAKPILAYLVLHLDRGVVLTELMRSKIHSNQILKQEFELCQRDLEKIKGITFNDSLTAFNLMFDCEKKIRLYARNEEVFDRLTKFYSTISSDSYFSNLLKQRLEKVFLEVKIRRKVSNFLCWILTSDYYAIPSVIDKIIDYFDNEDLQNIIKV